MVLLWTRLWEVWQRSFPNLNIFLELHTLYPQIASTQTASYRHTEKEGHVWSKIANVHSGNLTWPIFSGKYHQKWLMFHCYLGLPECITIFPPLSDVFTRQRNACKEGQPRQRLESFQGHSHDKPQKTWRMTTWKNTGDLGTSPNTLKLTKLTKLTHIQDG